MEQSLLIFIFVSTIQAVVFGFSLLLIKRGKPVPPPGALGYNVDAATKLAELEGHVTSLRLEFTEVVDRLERWSKRDIQRDKRDKKAPGDVLPTDKDLIPGDVPVSPADGLRMTPIQRLRVAKGR